MLPNRISNLKGILMDSFTLGPTPKIDFTQTVEYIEKMVWELAESSILPKHLLKAKRIQHRILYNWQA